MTYEESALQNIVEGKAATEAEIVMANLALAQIFATLYLSEQTKRIADISEKNVEYNLEYLNMVKAKANLDEREKALIKQEELVSRLVLELGRKGGGG